MNNIYITDEDIQRFVSGWPYLESVFAGCEILAGLDKEGTLHYYSPLYSYLRSNYWENTVQLAADKYHPCVVFGLKSDGTCVVSKEPFAGNGSYRKEFEATRMGNESFEGLLHSIHCLSGITQIAVNGSLFLALDTNGKMHAINYRDFNFDSFLDFLYLNSNTSTGQANIEDTVKTWNDVRRILLADEDIVIAQKNSGELLCAGYTQDLYGTFGKDKFLKLQDFQLIDACSFYGGESMHFAFLDEEKNLHDYMFSEHKGEHYIQIVGLDHSFLGLKDNGEIVNFQGQLKTDQLSWPPLKKISIGKRTRQAYDDLFLVGLSEW